jgi:hypothetical protein
LIIHTLVDVLQGIDSQVSFTFNIWTSNGGNPYLSVTAHYICAPLDNPQAWELKTKQLAFAAFEGHHSGANIALMLLKMNDKYGLHKKVLFLL